MTFPPSPECSIEDNSSVEPLTPSEFLLPSPIDDNDNCSTSIEVQNVTPTKYPSPSATPPLTYPSPPENQLGSTSTSEPSNIVRRRGPGRPSKAQLAADRQQPMGGSLITMRRQAHNETASRSRNRVKSAFEELWNELPESERLIDLSGPLSRAERIDIVISYIRKLQWALGKHQRNISGVK